MKEINIHKIIADKRKEKGITQEELAAYIGITKASVSKWETGQSYPDITFLPLLASYFNISIDELISYTPQMEQEDIKNLYYQEDFTSYTVNTGDYTLKKANKAKIDNAYHTIYKLKRDVKLYDIKRNYKGVMSAGTIIAISESYSGNTDNTLVRVNRVLNEND